MSVRTWGCKLHGTYVAVIPKCADCHHLVQRQDPLHDQMMDLIAVADRLGCRDAADWIKARWNTGEKYPQPSPRLLRSTRPTAEPMPDGWND